MVARIFPGNVYKKNEETGRFEDLNLPFADFWNPCITTVMETNTEERFENLPLSLTKTQMNANKNKMIEL